VDNHQEFHYGSHRYEHQENIMANGVGDARVGAVATGERESEMDEMEKRMFERADRH
jgi:hypothetical protein